MIKTLKRLGIEGTHLNMTKATCDKPPANITLNGDQVRTFPLRSERDKDAHCPLSYPTQHWKSQPEQSSKKKK